jgi:hypothetical protein
MIRNQAFLLFYCLVREGGLRLYSSGFNRRVLSLFYRTRYKWPPDRICIVRSTCAITRSTKKSRKFVDVRLGDRQSADRQPI